MELEEQVMGIIINAGQSRSLCYEALSCAKAGDFAAADEKMKEAAHFAREALTDRHLPLAAAARVGLPSPGERRKPACIADDVARVRR